MIYNNTPVDYKGIKLKTQSKEYTYLSKSRGTRKKINQMLQLLNLHQIKINGKNI